MPDGTSDPFAAQFRRWRRGDRAALDELTSQVYRQLHLAAEALLSRERPGHTLSAAALVNEAYLRLAGQNQAFESLRQFFGVATHLMRLILVDHARAGRAAKRGSGGHSVSFDQATLTTEPLGVDILALGEVLDRLFAVDERKGRAIELRYFAGMSVEETAAILGVSVATLRREIRAAENWLYRELTKP